MIILVRVIDGRIRLGQKIRLWPTAQVFEVEGLGYQAPKATPCNELTAGEVGLPVRQYQDRSRRQDRRHHHR